MKKYINYILATEFGTETYYDYNEVRRAYGRAESATLYGNTVMGDVTVILSK